MLLDLRNIISKHGIKIKGIIHIGGHHADEHDTYLSCGIENIMYFEPVKKNFEILKNKVGNNFIAHNFALGNFEGEIEKFIENDNRSMSCSILEPKLHLEQYPWIKFNEKELVKIKKLDTFNVDYTKFNMINIDVQGYELEVFKGASETLKNIDYIMSEINRDEVYKNCTKINELSDYLGNFGFIKVEESWAGNTWGDGFFIKKN